MRNMPYREGDLRVTRGRMTHGNDVGTCVRRLWFMRAARGRCACGEAAACVWWKRRVFLRPSTAGKGGVETLFEM